MRAPFDRAWTRVILAGCVWAGFAGGRVAGDGPGTILVYPDSDTSSNPRVPCIAPVSDGSGGAQMDIEATFAYAVAPFVVFPEGGKLTVRLRDTERREGKTLLALEDNGVQLAIQIAPASKGGTASLALSGSGGALGSLALPGTIGAEWADLELAWDTHKIACSMGGKPVGELALASPFRPHRLRVAIFSVSGLSLSGNGAFDLDWQSGYAARLSPRAGGSDLLARPFGFDTYFVSRDAAGRDFPMMEILNDSDETKVVSLEFDLHSEVRGQHQKWSQKAEAPARSSIFVPIAMPKPLATDIYHLQVSSADLSAKFEEQRHFAFVAPRTGPPGPEKFGLHDSSRVAFGYWPDALPIRIAHLYAYWGYIVGPPWRKDFHRGWGIDPKTPPSEWNWDRRLDWAIAEGLVPYVSLQSTPFLPWMREKDYGPDSLSAHAFGPSGGFPKLEPYRDFLREFTQRYRGKVTMYEVENEPNAHQMPAGDYVQIARAVSQAVHEADPAAQVFGMCATGDFVPWITEAFRQGAAQAMDGISIHTYVSPSTPEQANLPEKIAEVRKLIDSAGKPMPLVNSETGTYVSLREEIDHPIPPARLAALIAGGTPNLTVPRGWPNQAVGEVEGATSMVRNVVYNFLAGGRMFIFFGWNPAWPDAGWWTRQNPNSFDCFALISATKSGVPTPSLYSLAMGVVTTELESLIPETGQPINQSGILGGIFETCGGGQVAVLWSSIGKRSALLTTADPDPEYVTLFGQPLASASVPAGGLARSVQVSEEPVFVHLKKPGLALAPSPVINPHQAPGAGSAYRAQFTLVNRGDRPWSGEVNFSSEGGWRFEPEKPAFSLPPQGRATLEVRCVPPQNVARGAHTIAASAPLPDGGTFEFPLGLVVRDRVAVAALPQPEPLDQLAQGLPGAAIPIDQISQVAIGRAPGLASLQEEKYWKGPEELSATAQVGADEDGLVTLVRVRDAHPRAPSVWPGVGGSCVELFYDFRSAEGGYGRSAYEKGVYQVCLKPSLVPGEKVAVWNTSERFGTLAGTSAAGGRTSDGYWVAFHIPWTSIPPTARSQGTFGFDVAIDGPNADGPGRKSQLIWAGTAANSTDASAFGMATLTPSAQVSRK